MDRGDIGCARQTSLRMHKHTKCRPNGCQCACLVVTKQDLKFEQNPFMDSGDIGCERQICQDVSFLGEVIFIYINFLGTVVFILW